MAPLAGRPPFGTDERDSYYDEDPKPVQPRRQRPPAQKDDRASAYDVYDSYFDDSKDNRQSGMGALGFGFLNGSMDDDEDDDDGRMGRKSSFTKKSKHDMLAEATRREQTPSPPPQYIAQPKPGYAAPIAALDKLAKPPPAASPNPRTPMSMPEPQPLSVNTQPLSPLSASSPNPLAPPLSPITPAFARPRPPKSSEVTFEEKSIIRGDDEDYLRSRGQRGDDFWRRFSMVARENNAQRGNNTSAWLRKTQDGKSRLSTWVWIVGLVLFLIALGGIGIGVYSSKKSTSHNTPTAFGGSVGETGDQASSAVSQVGKGSPSAHTSIHGVSPTNTVARREPMFMAIAAHRRDLRHH